MGMRNSNFTAFPLSCHIGSKMRKKKCKEISAKNKTEKNKQKKSFLTKTKEAM